MNENSPKFVPFSRSLWFCIRCDYSITVESKWTYLSVDFFQRSWCEELGEGRIKFRTKFVQGSSAFTSTILHQQMGVTTML